MGEKLLVGVAALLALLVIGLGFFWQPETAPRDLPRPGLPAGGDFRLESAAGPVALADLRGRVVLLSFGYTACPDICPTTLATLADALAQLEPDEQARTASLFVSVDPQRDTPAHLQQYVAFFNPTIIGATASAAVLAELAARYGVIYQRPADQGDGSNYAIDHSADIFLIDSTGRIADKITHGTASTVIAQAVRKQLQVTR